MRYIVNVIEIVPFASRPMEKWM